MTTETDTSGENIAQTIRDLAQRGHHVDIIKDPVDTDGLLLLSVPADRQISDMTAQHIAALERFAPLRRRGTAQLTDLQSLIDWADRFKGPHSALFANPDPSQPLLTCIANYHREGPDDLSCGRSAHAEHCDHRGQYAFPLSDEWKAWTKIAGVPLDKDDMGEFIEANAKDVLDPTPAIINGETSDENADWENRLIDMARQIEGRFGQLHQLLQMSRQFQVFETSDLTASSNRDTGEQTIEFKSEHRDQKGAKLVVPNLIIIAIPVFRNGAPYRMAVRFRYRKTGGNIKFILTPYATDRAFKAAFEEAVNTAAEQTNLPLFMGRPES